MVNYDVLVVGAGPVGTTFARLIAQKGFKVAILEKKKSVGLPLQCAGLLGRKIKDVNYFPDELIINPVYGAYLHSPSNHVLSVAKKKPQAFVIDRIGYDKYLSQLAVDAGARLFLNHEVKDLNLEKGRIILNKQKGSMDGQIIVGSDGYNSVVRTKFHSSAETMQAAQFLVDFGKDLFPMDYVHLHVNSHNSPGFLWIIPLSKTTARVGLFGDYDYHTLNNILKDFLNKKKEFKGYSIVKKYHGRIPIYNPKNKIVKDRALLLGDAAAQVKPTTGGGLLLGFKCAKIAADVTFKALKEENTGILPEYESEYRKKFKKELNTQLQVQKIFKSLTDDDLDYMFLKLKETGAEKFISEKGDMDDQAPLVREMIKSGLMFKILPRILSRRISNLWK
jgi:digeranylgeranylglycerophospholipid reductase